LGNLEEGSSTGDFEIWMTGALRMEFLPLKMLSGEGFGRGSPFTWDPGRCVRENIRIRISLSLSPSL
jgi:hypothetical protein